jgi:hypothetical protein
MAVKRSSSLKPATVIHAEVDTAAISICKGHHRLNKVVLLVLWLRLTRSEEWLELDHIVLASRNVQPCLLVQGELFGNCLKRSLGSSEIDGRQELTRVVQQVQ